MAQVPSNLIPTRVSQLPNAPVASEDGLLLFIYQGNSYKIRAGDLLSVSGVPITRQVIAGTGLTGGGQLVSNVTLSIAPGGVGSTELASTGVTPGSYGTSGRVPVFNVDADGRLTSASSVDIVFPYSGTVTSVSGTGTVSGITLSGTVTSSGVLTLGGALTVSPSDFGSQTGNTVLAAPDGGGGNPTFRFLLPADIPTLNQNTTGQAGSVANALTVGSGLALSSGSTYDGSAARTITNSAPDQVVSLTGAGSTTVTGTYPNFTISSTGGGGGSGTVTSVTGVSPVSVATGTTTPVISLDTAYGDVKNPYASKTANFFLAAPNGTAGVPTFRAVVAADVPTLNQNTTGSAATLTTGRTISISGDLTYTSPSFNGSANVTAAGTLATVNANVGSFTNASITVNGKGLITAASSGAAPVTSVTGTSPVVSSGGATPAISLASGYGDTQNPYASKTANFFLAAPNGTAGAPTFRAVVAADIPTLNQNTTGTASNVTGTVAIANGGTGATTATTALTNLGAYPSSNPSGYTSNVGTVTSVGGTGTVSGLTLTGTVTSSGSLTLGGTLAVTPSDFASQTANTVLAAPNGSPGVPTFRALVAADIPTLNQNTTGTASNVTGTVAIANGGTGQTSQTAAFDALSPITTKGDLIVGDGTDNIRLAVGTNDYVLTADSAEATGVKWAAASGGGGASALVIDNKTAAYTVVAGDLGKVINCTANTFTVSLDAAATLGSGFNVTVWNTGTGAITLDPSGTETIDGMGALTLRNGEGFQIVCDGTNWQTGDKKAMRLYAENAVAAGTTRPIASGSVAVAIGQGSGATSTGSMAIGLNSSSTRAYSFATTFGVASGNYSFAAGLNSGAGGSVATSGAGAMALGGSRASGVDSFAAAVTNNTATYGATGANGVSIGKLSRASGTQGVAFGTNSSTTGGYGIAIGYQAQASGSGSVAIGNQYNLAAPVASGSSSIAIGDGCAASAQFSTAIGAVASSSIIGKYAYASGRFATTGDAQTGTFVLRSDTVGATPEALTTDNTAAGTTDQIILPNNSAYAFSGTIIARQQAAGGSDFAAWEIKGAILRGVNAASTTLGSFNINTLSKTAGATAWTIALTADTTNGGLAITVTGAAATNIRWVATVQTSEVTYA